MQYPTPDFEIPVSFREAAGKSVEQAKDAYGRLVDASRQAQEMALKSAEVFAVGSRELNEKVLSFAEANATAGFEAATRLAKARDVKEAIEIQTQFARGQIEAFTLQTQELSRIISTAAQKAQPLAA